MLLGKRTNVLIVKDDVGVSKPTTRKLPGDGFVFGKSNVHNTESAGEVTMDWKIHDPSQGKIAKAGPTKDFAKLNKLVIRDGATEAKANRAFRANHNASIKMGHGRDKSMKVPNVETATFGRPNRPQTPVGGIIHHGFQNAAEQDLQQKYVIWQEVKKNFKPSQIGVRMTNAQMHADAAVKTKNAPVEAKAEFKLKRFQNVDPRTSTKRGDQAYMVHKRAGKAASSLDAAAAPLE